MLIVMDNNELVDSSILYNHAMDNCEHIHTSTEDDNVNCCKKEFFPALGQGYFCNEIRQIVMHKNLALVVDICGEHFVKMGKLFSSSVPKNITWLYNGNKCHISSWY